MRIHPLIALVIVLIVGAGAGVAGFYVGLQQPRQEGTVAGWGRAIDDTVEGARKSLEKLSEDLDKSMRE